MTSAYGYITLATLESTMGKDFSAINSKYNDTMVETWITIAERMINGYCRTTFSGTISDAVQTATLLITQKIALNNLISDGHLKEAGVGQDTPLDAYRSGNYFTAEIKAMLENQKAHTTFSSVRPDYGSTKW